MSRNFGIMSARTDLGGNEHPPARYRATTPRDSIPSAEDFLQDGDFAALCFACAALASPFIVFGSCLVIWGLFFS